MKKINTFWRISFLIEQNMEFSVAKISCLADLPNAPPVLLRVGVLAVLEFQSYFESA